MKKILLSCLLAVFMLSAYSQERPLVRLVNNTGYTVYYVYISQVASDDWFEDVLGSEVLYDGQSTTTRLAYPLDVTNRYDIKMVDEDGDSYIKWNVLITPDLTIDFTFSDLDNSVTSEEDNLPRIRILNNTGYTVYYAYISQTATDDWEEDVLGDMVLEDGEYVTVKLSYPLDVVNRYDVKLVDEDDDSYTKWDVLITPDSEIEFTFEDLDL